MAVALLEGLGEDELLEALEVAFPQADAGTAHWIVTRYDSLAPPRHSSRIRFFRAATVHPDPQVRSCGCRLMKDWPEALESSEVHARLRGLCDDQVSIVRDSAKAALVKVGDDVGVAPVP